MKPNLKLGKISDDYDKLNKQWIRWAVPHKITAIMVNNIMIFIIYNYYIL